MTIYDHELSQVDTTNSLSFWTHSQAPRRLGRTLSLANFHRGFMQTSVCLASLQPSLGCSVQVCLVLLFFVSPILGTRRCLHKRGDSLLCHDPSERVNVLYFCSATRAKQVPLEENIRKLQNGLKFWRTGKCHNMLKRTWMIWEPAWSNKIAALDWCMKSEPSGHQKPLTIPRSFKGLPGLHWEMWQASGLPILVVIPNLMKLQVSHVKTQFAGRWSDYNHAKVRFSRPGEGLLCLTQRPCWSLELLNVLGGSRPVPQFAGFGKLVCEVLLIQTSTKTSREFGLFDTVIAVF